MKTISTLLLLIIAQVLYAQPGSLDPSFGTNGLVNTVVNQSSDGRAIAVQPDGKIVLGGSSYNGTFWSFTIIRYNTNGTLDNSFNGTGNVTTEILSSDAYITGIAIQNDGKIVAAGLIFGGNNKIALVRYNSNGTLDNSFGSGGKVISDLQFDLSVNTLCIQNDGKILIAGALSKEFLDFMIVRYNSDGSLDNSFGLNGIVDTDFGDYYNREIKAIAIQPDGKIVACGQIDYQNTSGIDFAIARYNTDGSLDNTFNSSGTAITNIGAQDFAQSVSIQSDGKIVVGGLTNDGFGPSGTYSSFAVARYNENGSLDNSFGNNGTQTTNVNQYAAGYALAIQPDNKIVVAGYSSSNANDYSTDFTVVRYLANGTLDDTFRGGVSTIDFGADDRALTMCLFQNRIYVGGYSYIQADNLDRIGLAALEMNNPTTYYQDSDGDGFGNPDVSLQANIQPAGYVTNSLDCDDINAFINPNTTWFLDLDNDGYYTGPGTQQCSSPGTGYKYTGLISGGDCNDNNANINPDKTEICGNGIDDNCNGQIDENCAATPPAISIEDKTVYESQGIVIINVSLNKTATKNVKVSYTTLDGTALSKGKGKNAAGDFTAAKGNLTIPAGSLSGSISIQIINDGVTEADEHFTIQLSNPMNATIADGTSVVTIKDGVPPTLTLANAETTKSGQNSKVSIGERFGVNGYPNPTAHSFNIAMQSPNACEKIMLRVIDVLGRVIEIKDGLHSGQILKLGENYRPGTYIIEAIQNNQVKTIKLVKLSE